MKIKKQGFGRIDGGVHKYHNDACEAMGLLLNYRSYWDLQFFYVIFSYPCCYHAACRGMRIRGTNHEIYYHMTFYTFNKGYSTILVQ